MVGLFRMTVRFL